MLSKCAEKTMTNWYMLTLIGTDQPGIVAKITTALLNAKCNLGEASMMRLGGNFTIMLMINSQLNTNDVKQLLTPCCNELSLHIHIDKIEGHLHDHHIPDLMVTVSGVDREGIVSQVTNLLFNAGMDILDLSSDVAGTKENPLYIIQIEGVATKGIDAIEKAIQSVTHNDIDIQIQTIDTIIA